jgi:hypothetical protein
MISTTRALTRCGTSRAFSAPRQVANRCDSTSVYWTDNSGAVWSVPRSGEQGGALTALGTAPGPTSSIALEARVLYWASGFTDPTQVDCRDRGDAGYRRRGHDARVGLNAPGHVVLDDRNVYFDDIGAGTISAVSQQGGAATVLASNQVGIGGFAVADGVVYWSNFSGAAGAVVGQPAPTPAFGDGTINAVTSDGSSSCSGLRNNERDRSLGLVRVLDRRLQERDLAVRDRRLRNEDHRRRLVLGRPGGQR